MTDAGGMMAEPGTPSAAGAAGAAAGGTPIAQQQHGTTHGTTYGDLTPGLTSPSPAAAGGGGTGGMSGGSIMGTGSSSMGGSASAGSSSSVLSQKVSRALEVRTDTPAMMAALDALADLPSGSTAATRYASGAAGGSGGAGAGARGAHQGEAGEGVKSNILTGSIDPRSIRHAIEIDALHQAKLFQSELKSIVNTVVDLRGRIKGVAEASEMVKREMGRDVVGASLDYGRENHHGRHHDGQHGGHHHRGGHGHGGGKEHHQQQQRQPTQSSPTTTTDEDVLTAALRGHPHDPTNLPSSLSSLSTLSITDTYGTDALSSERRLASLLHSAFVHRHEAAVRARTVREFMDRFDLSEGDAYLLDHYSFEEFEEERSGGGGGRYYVPPPLKSAQEGKEGAEENGGAENGTMGAGGDGDAMAFLDALEHVRRIRTELIKTFNLELSSDVVSSSKVDALLGDGAATTTSSPSSSLGLTSALRMMETLSAKEERSYERLYDFLTTYLDLHSRSVSNVPTSSPTNPQHGGGGRGGTLLPRSNDPKNRALIDEDAMDETLRHPFVVRALHVLRHKPSYHAHTLELIAASRRALVTRKFLLALTSGYDGLPPIEMGAHDPVHYVGDMLAFVFRIESEEADLAGGLVGSGGEGGGFVDVDEEAAAAAAAKDGENREEETVDSNAVEAAAEDDIDRPMSSTAVLSHATSGISRPLKSRIVQVISSLARHPDDNDATAEGDLGSAHEASGHGPDGTLTAHDLDEEAGTARNHLAQLYEICGLLLYYRSAFHKTVARLDKAGGGNGVADASDLDENALIKCIQECLDEAAGAFGASLRVYSATLPNLASLSNESESALVQGTVGRICEVRMASPGFFGADETPAEDRLAPLSLEFLIDTTVNAAMSNCDRLDDAVALRNAVLTAKKAGLDVTVASKWDKAMSERERALADSLIEGETRRVVEDCGLAPVADALKDMEAVYVEGMVIASHPGLGPEDVKMALKDFYDSLYSPPLPSFDMIRDPVLRKYARAKTAENVVELYSKIYDALKSERGGYDDLSFLGHEPAQVKTLLSL